MLVDQSVLAGITKSEIPQNTSFGQNIRISFTKVHGDWNKLTASNGSSNRLENLTGFANG